MNPLKINYKKTVNNLLHHFPALQTKKDEAPTRRSITYEELRQQSRANARGGTASPGQEQYSPMTSNQDYDRRIPNRERMSGQENENQQQDVPSSQNRKPTFFADKPQPSRSSEHICIDFNKKYKSLLLLAHLAQRAM